MGKEGSDIVGKGDSNIVGIGAGVAGGNPIGSIANRTKVSGGNSS